MTEACTTCRNIRINVAMTKSAMGAAARKAARFGHERPSYIEAANQAKAKYIAAREYGMAHEEFHARDEATA